MSVKSVASFVVGGLAMWTMVGKDPWKLFFESSTSFTKDLYSAVLATQKNDYVFSPLSVRVVLSLLKLGARDETAERIAKLLALPSDRVIRKSGLSLILKLKNNNKGSVSIHNILYINRYAKVNDIFKKNGRKYFNTSIEQLDFADSQSAYEALHYWIDDKTNYTTREKDLFEIDDLNHDIKMVSLNAMRFFGKWIAKSIVQTNDTFNLNEKETTMIPFLKIETSYVRYHNFEDLDAVGIELPYEGREYTMLFLMANEDDGLAHLERSLTAINLQTLELTEQFQNVLVYVPEFDISTNLDLREPLKKLGLSDLFEDDACLRGIAPKIKLEFMKQTTTLGVDETGTQVTVATAGNAHRVINYRNKKKEKKMHFKIDRPFVFMIREIQTLGPLFIGRYTGFKDEDVETIELF